MIRILQVVSDLDINSGALMVVMNYYRHIDRNKIQFDFIYFYEIEDDKMTHKEEIHSLGGRYYFIGKPKLSKQYQNKVKNYFDNHKGEYMAIHCHPIWAAEIFAPEAKKAGIKHVIQHSHSTKLGNNKLSIIRNRILMKGIDYFATDYAACSQEAAALLGKREVNIFRNAIDCQRFSFDQKERERIRKELIVDDDTILVGHVGRFTAEKNHLFLVDVFKEIVSQKKNFRLVLVGDGPLREQVQQYVLSIPVLNNRVFFLGRRSDIPSILSACDLFVLPSKYEGVPFAAIEAQAEGLHTVLSDCITKSIETKLTSYISLNVDLNDWAATIIEESKKNEDRNDQSAIINLGYDISVEAKKMEKYYEALV